MLSKFIVAPLVAAVALATVDDPKVDYAKSESAFTFNGTRWPSTARTAGTAVDRIVVHSTFVKSKKPAEWFGKDAIFAVWRAEKDSTGKPFISVHYFIDREGKVFQLVPEKEIANHAKGYNSRSVGVELAGIADEFAKEAKEAGASDADLAYTDAQYKALSGLLTDIKTRHSEAKAIKHSDIYEKDDKGEYKRRKSDPGSKFDEKKLSSKVDWTTSHKGE
ncbi:MAG: N-acetylmuramoyl-L-alanine amidase [Phycisphaerae bacterium]|nr:N-acetylmuramoyl-L-alanine amidase [Phycisphaerae bacterium]